MLRYYFMLGVRGLRRNAALTALMVLTLAIGVAASVATLTIVHVMSGDPIPGKSARLFSPLLDNGELAGYVPGAPPADDLMTYRDAAALLAGQQGARRTAIYGTSLALEPARADMPPSRQQGLATTRDFFAMFEVPLRYGQPWSAADEARGADVLLISAALSETLFGQADPVGRRVRLGGVDYQIAGVTGRWAPLPRYYQLANREDAFDSQEDYFIPLATAVRHQIDLDGSMHCHAPGTKPGFQGRLESECTWIQFWFETAGARERGMLLDYLNSYTREQFRLGRFQRRGANQLFDVMDWLEHRKVVGNDQRLAAWLAFGFLLLCLVNTVGLLLAKFSARAAEVGIRRALGASRRAIFQQFLIETAVIGLGGGVLGLLFAFLALKLIALQSKTMETVAHLDPGMLALTFALSVLAALLAGLLPTWRACQITPAMQLKSQ